MLSDSYSQPVLFERLPAFQCSATDAAQHLHQTSRQPAEDTQQQFNLHRTLQKTKLTRHALLKHDNMFKLHSKYQNYANSLLKTNSQMHKLTIKLNLYDNK